MVSDANSAASSVSQEQGAMLARVQCCLLVKASLAAGLMPAAAGAGGHRLPLLLQDRLGCFSPAQAPTCSGLEQFGSFAHALFCIFIKNDSYLARGGGGVCGKKSFGSENSKAKPCEMGSYCSAFWRGSWLLCGARCADSNGRDVEQPVCLFLAGCGREGPTIAPIVLPERYCESDRRK